jgi:hypothetical protein
MDPEEMAKKYSMKELKPLAKKYGISTHCVKKLDIVKALPPEALAELEKK